MLADNSVLRNLPIVFDKQQLLAIDAVVFAADSIEASISIMRAIATKYKGALATRVSHFDRVQLISRAWSVVDCLHVIRQIAPADLAGSSAFRAKYEAATHMRNKMDHLHQNLGNLAAGMERIAPVFGALSYVAFDDEDLEDGAPLGCSLVSLIAGPLTHDEHRIKAVNPAGRELSAPVDAFQLSAFGYDLEFQDVTTDVGGLLEALENAVHQTIEKDLPALSAETGVSLDEMKQVRAYNAAIVAKVRFSKPT